MHSTEQKIDSALAYLLDAQESISIAKVCRLAQVSRANLYANYPQIVGRLREESRRYEGKRTGAIQKKMVHQELLSLKKEVKFLLYVCAELKLTLQSERQTSNSLRAELIEARAAYKK